MHGSRGGRQEHALQERHHAGLSRQVGARARGGRVSVQERATLHLCLETHAPCDDMDKDFFIVEHALKVPYCHVTLLISTATPHVHNLSSFVMPRNRFVVFVSCKRREKPRHFSVGSGDQEVIKTNLDKIA